MVRLKNGILAYPRLHVPPESIAGYKVDPRDPYVFYPIIPKCDYRITIMVRDKTCHCDKPCSFCKNGLERQVNLFADCYKCKLNKTKT